MQSSNSLNVPHLEKLRQRMMMARNGKQQPLNSVEFLSDHVTLAGLGLALEETYQYLFRTGPTLEEFEKWVLQRNDGHIAPERIERINAALENRPPSAAQQKIISEIESAPPVLSAEDLAFWEENGYVIARGAISKEQSRAAEQMLWKHLEMDPENPGTWYGHDSKSIMVQFYHHDALRSIRQSPRIHKAFAQLWGTADLWVTTDRVSFNPPERPGYAFPGPRLHWDTSLAQPIPFGLQGLIYLTDTQVNQGAFTCVPGFHRRIGDWLKILPRKANPREQNLDNQAVPIAANAGDLIIWHQALPHGSSPNRATQPRMVHYVTMFPFRPEPDRPWI